MNNPEPQLTRSVDEPDAVTYTLGERIKRVLAVPGRLLGALVIPDRTMPAVVARERGAPALVAIVLCGAIAAFVLGSRVDPTPAVLQEETAMQQMRAQGGDGPEARSDREIGEEIAKRRTMIQVQLGLSAGLYTPFLIGLLAVGIFLLGRFVGGKPNMSRSFAAAAHASLPTAVKSIVVAIAAASSEKVAPMDIEKLGRIGAFGPVPPFHSLDAFVLWTAVLLVFGLAAAASISRRRALVATLVAFTLFLLLTGEVGPGPGGPGGHPAPPRGAP